MQLDAVGDFLDGWGVVWSAGVAVGPAAFTGAWAGPAFTDGVEVVLTGQLGADVAQDDGQLPWGERAARLAQSLAACMALVKLTRPGSSLGAAA